MVNYDPGVIEMTNRSPCILAGIDHQAQSDEFGAVKNAYWEQIKFGITQKMALSLATIVYQQRHPFSPRDEARGRVAKALDIEIRSASHA